MQGVGSIGNRPEGGSLVRERRLEGACFALDMGAQYG
jgi:hypothetical protein